MALTPDTPTFAVVGAVNHGKSSVVSTLAEDDQVRISAMPGETVECQRFSLKNLFVFIDTPGFQNAFEALAELAPAAEARDPLQLFRNFIKRHRGEPEFDAECRLFQPITEGAGVVYVVDGSRPVLDLHDAEMEILRLTGQPRLAVINRTGTDNFVTDWKRRLSLHFNAVREFNAHTANFADRIELLETLAGIEQSWKPKLSQAVKIFSEEWNARLGECAEIVVEMLCDCLRLTKSEPPASDSPTARKVQAEALSQTFKEALSRREAEAHAAIIELFGHSLIKPGSLASPAFDDLFSTETWRMLGLSENQLIATAAAIGAATGASVDLLTAGHTLLMGAAIGSALGAAGAWYLGKQRPELKVKAPAGLGRFQFGGTELTIGPLNDVNFPWILLDRALGTFAYVVNRAHARRDEVALDATSLLRVLNANKLATKDWPDDVRKPCIKLIAAIQTGKLSPEKRAQLKLLICKQLEQANTHRLDFSQPA